MNLQSLIPLDSSWKQVITSILWVIESPLYSSLGLKVHHGLELNLLKACQGKNCPLYTLNVHWCSLEKLPHYLSSSENREGRTGGTAREQEKNKQAHPRHRENWLGYLNVKLQLVKALVSESFTSTTSTSTTNKSVKNIHFHDMNQIILSTLLITLL